MELECEATGELAAIHTSTAVKNYVFSAENMTKLEESFKQVSGYKYKFFFNSGVGLNFELSHTLYYVTPILRSKLVLLRAT